MRRTIRHNQDGSKTITTRRKDIFGNTHTSSYRTNATNNKGNSIKPGALGPVDIFQIAKGKKEAPNNLSRVKIGISSINQWKAIFYVVLPVWLFLLLFSFFAPGVMILPLIFFSFFLFFGWHAHKAKKIYKMKLKDLNAKQKELDYLGRPIKKDIIKENEWLISELEKEDKLFENLYKDI